MELTKEQQEKKREIIASWLKGGSHAHNVVCWGLQAIAKDDKELAEHIYKELQDEHGY